MSTIRLKVKLEMVPMKKIDINNSKDGLITHIKA